MTILRKPWAKRFPVQKRETTVSLIDKKIKPSPPPQDILLWARKKSERCKIGLHLFGTHLPIWLNITKIRIRINAQGPYAAAYMHRTVGVVLLYRRVGIVSDDFRVNFDISNLQPVVVQCIHRYIIVCT